MLEASSCRRCSAASDSWSSALHNGAGELVEHRSVAQEPLGLVGQARERFAVEVVGDVAVVTCDGKRIVVLVVLGDHRGEVKADGPAFGAFRHRGREFRRHTHVSVGEDLRGAGCVEGKVARPELQRVSRRAQTRQVRLLETTCRHELRVSGYPRDHEAQHVVAGRRLKLVQVVEHEHERLGARPERRREARRGAAQHRDAEPAHVGDQSGVVGSDPRRTRRPTTVSRVAGSSS